MASSAVYSCAIYKIKLSREEIKDILREHDLDGDGSLSMSELIRAFGFLGHILPYYKAHYGLAYADVDGDHLFSECELDKLIDYVERFQFRKC